MRASLLLIASLLMACTASSTDESHECPTFVAPCQSSLSIDFDRTIARDYEVLAVIDGEELVADCTAEAEGGTADRLDTRLEDADGRRGPLVTCSEGGLFFSATPEALFVRIVAPGGDTIGEGNVTPSYEDFGAGPCGGGSCRSGSATLGVD